MGLRASTPGMLNRARQVPGVSGIIDDLFSSNTGLQTAKLLP